MYLINNHKSNTEFQINEIILCQRMVKSANNVLVVAAKSMTIFFVLCTLASCYKDPNYPIRPKITFNDLQIREVTQTIGGLPITRTQISIALNFTDGDGDLGLFPTDTMGPFKLFFVNGRDTTFNLNYYNIFPTVMAPIQ